MGKLIARASFFAPTKDGAEVFIGQGQEIEDTHEIVKGREGLFDAAPGSADPAPKKRANVSKKATDGAPDAD